MVNKKQHLDLLGNLKIYNMKKVYAVTGTFHGSIIWALNEGGARRMFHKMYNGESITHVKDISNHNLSNL